MKNLKKIIIPVILSVTMSLQAQIPERPNPPRLLNDLAKILTEQQAYNLETNLADFSRTTSNQIAVVIVDDLNGLPASDFAYQIGEKWGVGKRKFNNGIVVLIKIKNQTGGEAFIATGYGLEAVLPDATCKRIIENEMIPAFRENDYYAGIVNALKVIMPVAKGEFSHEDYAKEPSPLATGIVMLVFLSFLILLAVIAHKHKGDDFTGKNGGRRGMNPMTAILLGSMLGGSGRSGGSFGGGGFGGFGGGSFGGGGAGGRW